MTMFRKMMGSVGIPQDFIAAYNFNGNTNDRSANALNGSLSGGATITNDRLNVASVGSYMNVGDSDLLSFGSGAFSFSFKFLINTLTANNLFICKRDDVSNINNARTEYYCSLANNKFRLLISDSSQSIGSSLLIESIQTLSANTEYKVQVTFGGGVGNNFKIYINGSLISHTYTLTGNYAQMRNTTARLIIGNIGWDSGSPLYGYIDNLYIYNRELTAAECTLLANE